MIEFLNHAMMFPTLIPFSGFVIMFCFFVVSILFGFNKDIVTKDIELESGDSDVHVSGGNFLYFIGIKPGVHTTSLIFISLFFDFAIVFFLSALFNMKDGILGTSMGIAIPIILFPILNNILYYLIKPLSDAFKSSISEHKTIIGSQFKIVKILVDSNQAYVVELGKESDDFSVSFENQDMKELKIGDIVKVSEIRINDSLNNVYYAVKEETGV